MALHRSRKKKVLQLNIMHATKFSFRAPSLRPITKEKLKTKKLESIH
jgi:hypothetical protein